MVSVADLRVEPDARLLLLTNLTATRARRAMRNQVGAMLGKSVVLGAREIGASLDRHPRLRAAMPSVLGLRDPRDRGRSRMSTDRNCWMIS